MGMTEPTITLPLLNGQTLTMPFNAPRDFWAHVFQPSMGKVQKIWIHMESADINAQVDDVAPQGGGDFGTADEQRRADEVAGDYAKELFDHMTVRHEDTCGCRRCMVYAAVALLRETEVATQYSHLALKQLLRYEQHRRGEYPDAAWSLAQYMHEAAEELTLVFEERAKAAQARWKRDN